MRLFWLLLCTILGSGALGFMYGARVEAAAWKRIVEVKGFALAEWLKLRKAL